MIRDDKAQMGGLTGIALIAIAVVVIALVAMSAGLLPSLDVTQQETGDQKAVNIGDVGVKSLSETIVSAGFSEVTEPSAGETTDDEDYENGIKRLTAEYNTSRSEFVNDSDVSDANSTEYLTFEDNITVEVNTEEDAGDTKVPLGDGILARSTNSYSTVLTVTVPENSEDGEAFIDTVTVDGEKYRNISLVGPNGDDLLGNGVPVSEGTKTVELDGFSETSGDLTPSQDYTLTAEIDQSKGTATHMDVATTSTRNTDDVLYELMEVEVGIPEGSSDLYQPDPDAAIDATFGGIGTFTVDMQITARN